MSDGRPVAYFHKRALEERFDGVLVENHNLFLVFILFHSLISIGIGRSSVQRMIP